MAQIRCDVCSGLSRKESQYCPECNGSTWVDAPTKCNHKNAKGEAMTGGWICIDCGDSGPGIPPTWTWDEVNRQATPPQ